jgi:hypothetical protein
MALPQLLQTIATALDKVERGIGGDTSINPINVINGIRITLTAVREGFQRSVQITRDIIHQRDHYQELLHNANEQITRLTNDQQRLLNVERDRDEYRRAAHRLTVRYNTDTERWRRRHSGCLRQAQNWKGRCQVRDQIINNLRQQIFALQNNPLNMATMVDVNQLLMPQLAVLPYYDGQEDPDSYYAKLRTINESARPLAVGAFNPAARCNIMIGKMTGRFHPVPATNPYNAGNNVVTEPEFLNWLKGKYREVMVGTSRDALKALANEKFTPMDTVDTYEKRIKPYTLGLPFNDVLPYLYEHMPNYIEIRLRQGNPADLDAFFTNLRKIWLESRGRNDGVASNQPSSAPIVTVPVQQPVKDDFKLRLARDLQYAGIATDDASLENFIYEELTKRLTKSANHIRRNPFEPKNTYATKKVTKKVIPKVVTKVIRRCSVCGKSGHTKVNCPASAKRGRVKKVNYVYQDESDDPPEEEEEYIEESIIVDDSDDDDDDDEEDEYVDNNESRNCYAIKKNWS